MQEHPRETPFICDRANSDHRADPYSLESTSIIELQTKHSESVIPFDIADTVLINILQNKDAIHSINMENQ
jgi:hypothetical protein